ncbi:cold-shock protein [Nocardia sp. BMG51109]|uniref:cold-shock protein n=1 Tax=Nocardia sp. BMG51109 TaxID=1056816 RepID=UPI0004652D5B|nr:cold-shock protein [Nocardia sp. BMG51109]
MTTGRVKWFDDARGFGFISQDGDEPDVYVHHSAIVGDGHMHRTLDAGQRVQFEIDWSDSKGPRATNVRPSGADGARRGERRG